MKRKILFLIFSIYGIPFVMGETYQLNRGLIFYRSGKDTIVAVSTDYIPSDTVFVRMHKESKKNDKFEVSNSEGKEFIGSAPKEWPGKKLMDCLEPKGEQTITELPKEVDVNIMGGAKLKHAPQFHYLFAFASLFDDSHWKSFSYDSSDSIKMQQALNKLQEQLNYLQGKQYLLTQQSTTKEKICICLDSILRNTGEGDMVFLFLSGHGEKDQEGLFHFITKNTRKNDSVGAFSNSLTKSAINHYIHLLTSKKARVLFFMDACYAGEMDDAIPGEAAYYLSTNGENPAYYNSPFAKALMNVMSGKIDNRDSIFIENQVQVGSLGNYLSKAVYVSNQHQRPICNEHGFDPACVLWKLPSAPQDKQVETDTKKYTYKYPFSARSFVPGWQQIYKGSTSKGVGIICVEAVGVAGIITSFSIKAYNEKLMKTDPKHVQEYSSRANTCQYVGYGCIALTAGFYIYNLIDAAVAPGKKPISVDKEITFAPSMTLDGSICLTMNYKF